MNFFSCNILATYLIIYYNNMDRTSALALIHVGFERLKQEDKESLTTIFLQLCLDDTPTVRRAAAQNFYLFVNKLKSTELSKDFVSSLQSLMSDDQDSVRINAVSSCMQLSKVLSTTSFSAQVLPLVASAVVDASWRIRWSVANHLHILFVSFHGDKSMVDKLLVVYSDLLSDSESEVRAAALATVDAVCKHLSKEQIVNSIFPQLRRIANDSSEVARASLANVLNNISETLGKDATVETLLPLLLLFLRDESPDVRLNIIAKLDKLSNVIGVQLLSQSLIPAITELSKDSKWRVRSSVIENVPMLLEHLGKALYQEKLNDMYFGWMKDAVWSVRKVTASKLPSFVNVFGEEWTVAEILPQIEKMRQDSSHMNRSTAVYCFEILLPSFSCDTYAKHVVPLLLLAAKDAVPNVRLNAVRALESFLRLQGGGRAKGGAEAVEAFETLSLDGDKDVRYFAKKALTEFHSNKK